jgi:hypothetical protein
MIGLYLLCAVAGFSFMGLSLLMGQFGGHAHGHAGSLGHHGHGGGVQLPVFSPMAIAAYVTGFGSAGLLLTQAFHIHNPLIHLPASLAFAAAFGVGNLFMMAKLAEHTEGNSLASLGDVVGTEVEVTIAIPEGGDGEVGYVAGGTRTSCIARAEAGQTFAQNTRVRVTRAVDGTLYVTKASALPESTATMGEPLESPPREKVR